MAVTLTQSQLMNDLGVTADRADRLLNVATALITRYMGAATYPDSIGDEAALRCAGWLSQTPFGSTRAEDTGGIKTEYATSMRGALKHSGAEALLRPWKRRGALSIGGKATSTTAPETTTQPGDESMPTLPSVKFYTVPLSIPDVTFATLPNMTGQEVVGAGAEVVAVTRQAISTAAPVTCHQQSFRYTSANCFVVVAKPDGEDTPSHYRLKDELVTNAWAWPLPATGGNLSNTWRASSGQAVIAGASFDVFWWPALFTVFPETTVFEWPL